MPYKDKAKHNLAQRLRRHRNRERDREKRNVEHWFVRIAIANVHIDGVYLLVCLLI